jgi:phage-related protein
LVDKRPKGKPIDWVGSSRDDLKSFPEEVQQVLGFELYQVQLGDMPASTKPLKGHLSGVYELRESHEGNAYRAVYVAKLKDKIYVLHCFKKKSKRGIATPQKDIDVITKRLILAIEDSKGAKK